MVLLTGEREAAEEPKEEHQHVQAKRFLDSGFNISLWICQPWSICSGPPQLFRHAVEQGFAYDRTDSVMADICKVWCLRLKQVQKSINSPNCLCFVCLFNQCHHILTIFEQHCGHALISLIQVDQTISGCQFFRAYTDERQNTGQTSLKCFYTFFPKPSAAWYQNW